MFADALKDPAIPLAFARNDQQKGNWAKFA